MYFDLNVHVPPSGSGLNRHQPSKKGKAKQTVVSNDTTVTYSSSQLAKIELQIDLLVHCELCMRLIVEEILLFSQ